MVLALKVLLPEVKQLVKSSEEEIAIVDMSKQSCTKN